MRRPVIGVMGGGNPNPAAEREAEELGRLIAEHGWMLLNGGRNAGVMAASTRGAKEAGGFVVGILPDSDGRQATADLDLVIPTGMGDARNVINVLASDVVIACAGSAGTLSEVALALKNGKPVIVLGFDPGPALQSFLDAGQLRHATSAGDAVLHAASLLAHR